MDQYSRGFVEILAAEQTPAIPNWFQGTADAVRKALRHFLQHDADFYLILAGDHLYRMDYAELLDAHVQGTADITIAALPVDADDATGMGIFTFDGPGRIAGFEEKPNRERLAQMGPSLGAGAGFQTPDPKRPYIASMGIYLFTREVLLELLERERAIDFGRELIPAALTRYRVRAFSHRGYWADVGTISSFYEANIMLTRGDAPFNFYHPTCPIYTHARFLPPSKLAGCDLKNVLVAEGCFIEAPRSPTRSSASARQSAAARASRTPCSSARTTTRRPRNRMWIATYPSASVATSSSIASSSTRTRGLATAPAW